MLLYWLADMFALWAAIAASGFQMNVAATLGTFSYRFFSLWPPQPFSLLGIPRLQAILARAEKAPGGGSHEPALRG